MTRFSLRFLPYLLAGASLACGSSSATGPCVPTPVDTACLAGPATFVAVVARITHESGNTPAGPIDQYDFWMTIPPSPTPNVGVVAGAGIPVFLQVGSGPLYPTVLANIQVGDRVSAWVSANGGYGSPQAPPGAPVHLGQQLVIQR